MTDTFATTRKLESQPDDTTFSSRPEQSDMWPTRPSTFPRGSSADTYDITDSGQISRDTRTLPVAPEGGNGPERTIAKPIHQYRISGLSSWTGRVTQVDQTTFSAELVPDDSTGGSTVVADFAVDQVVAEGETLSPGDVVYVTSRTVRASHGGKSETSSIRLRRLGVWSDLEAEASLWRARKEFDSFSGLID